MQALRSIAIVAALLAATPLVAATPDPGHCAMLLVSEDERAAAWNEYDLRRAYALEHANATFTFLNDTGTYLFYEPEAPDNGTNGTNETPPEREFPAFPAPRPIPLRLVETAEIARRSSEHALENFKDARDCTDEALGASKAIDETAPWVGQTIDTWTGWIEPDPVVILRILLKLECDVHDALGTGACDEEVEEE